MLRHLLCVVSVSLFWGFFGTPVSAASSNLVISHLQTGGAGSGTSGQEFIAVYNNSSALIDVSDWCLKYSDYTNTSISELYCFARAADMDTVLMSGHAFSVIVSQSYPVLDMATITARYKNSTTALSGTRGHVLLFDKQGAVVDRVAWDNGASTPPVTPEVKAAAAPVGGNMIVREFIIDHYIDTDNNYNDFVSILSSRPIASSLIDYKEPPVVVDVCANISDVQQSLPEGYGFDSLGDCYSMTQDMCANIDLIQLAAPESMVVFVDGNCYDINLDVCPNMDGFQLTVPAGNRIDGNICRENVGIKKIKITELLANSVGSDTGNEFIELYNSDSAQVHLYDYSLYIGKNAEKQISLPDVILQPNMYIAFSDTDLGFTLLNTTTRLELHYFDGTLVDEIIAYQDRSDEIAWALIDGVWQYTNNPTPALANQASIEEVLGETTEKESALVSCPAGKYRNPLTNRCRNIEADASVLAACDADEYRSPDTNRCRKITLAGTALTPCDEGYERNSETNRCRKTSTASTLAACQQGYERNPETNRCKKAMQDTAHSSLKESIAKNDTGGISLHSPYLVAATAGVGAVGYGVYEWRTELGLVLRRILGVFIRK